jgi:hypothetical protein
LLLFQYAVKADADPPTLFKKRIKELLSRHTLHISSYENADPLEGFKAAAAVMLAEAGVVYQEELVGRPCCAAERLEQMSEVF